MTSVLTRWRLHQHRGRGERWRSLPRTSALSPRQPRPPHSCTSALLPRLPFSLSFSVSCWPALDALVRRGHIERTCCNRPCRKARAGLDFLLVVCVVSSHSRRLGLNPRCHIRRSSPVHEPMVYARAVAEGDAPACMLHQSASANPSPVFPCARRERTT